MKPVQTLPTRDHNPPEPGHAWGLAGPQPVDGDASFSRLLGRQRQVHAEHLQSDHLDADAAELLPLMLSLARLSARAMVQGAAR
jgi:hypothetical protein